MDSILQVLYAHIALPDQITINVQDDALSL
jgi:hypothetical protein